MLYAFKQYKAAHIFQHFSFWGFLSSPTVYDVNVATCVKYKKLTTASVLYSWVQSGLKITGNSFRFPQFGEINSPI